MRGERHHVIEVASRSRRRVFAGRSVLSTQGVALMQTPPAGAANSYAMGWVASNVDGTPAIEHNGVLSTFYAHSVLLPERNYGFGLLYNIYGLAESAVAFPEINPDCPFAQMSNDRQ